MRKDYRVKLPGGDRAVVAPEKVHDYLLSSANPRARGKPAFFRVTLRLTDVREVTDDELVSVRSLDSTG